MRVAADNKLAILQTQYQELFEQTQMLCSQLPGLQQQITSMQPYLTVNNGDRRALVYYNNAMQQFNRVNNKIQQNNMRLAALQRSIAVEESRISDKLGKMQMQQARAAERQSIKVARNMQRQMLRNSRVW